MLNKIILDFDNTIAQSAETILQMNGHKEIDPKILEWDFAPYAKTGEEKKLYLDTFQNPLFWDNLIPMPGFAQWLNAQSLLGLDIYVCSRRLPGQFTRLIEWMKSYGFDEYIKDYILVSKSTDTKSMLIDDSTVIIDDNPKSFGDVKKGLKVRFGNYAYGQEYDENQGLIFHYPDWQTMPNWYRYKQD